MDCDSRRAMVFRIWLSGTSWKASPVVPGMVVAAGRAPAAAGRVPSTSRATTRPSGPEPGTEAMSIPRSAAIRRASGEAFTLPPAAAPPACAPSGCSRPWMGRGAGGAGCPLPPDGTPAAGGIEVGWFRSGAGWVACSAESAF